MPGPVQQPTYNPEAPAAVRPVVPRALVSSASGLVAPEAAAAASSAVQQPSEAGGGGGLGTRGDVTTPSEVAIRGKRTDLPEGFGFRVRIGLNGAGTDYVIEKWTESGTKTTAVFA